MDDFPVLNAILLKERLEKLTRYKNTTMEVICIQDSAFYFLLEKVVEWVKEKNEVKKDKWISPEEAMRILRIKSKSTLQKLRDGGKIRFSQPEKKHVVYDIDSLYEYLENHVHEVF